VLLVLNETKHNQIETKFNFAVRLFTEKMSMKKETHATVIRPELNINMGSKTHDK
jgi:hypothetical protein